MVFDSFIYLFIVIGEDMYGVVEINSHQYKVQAGQLIDVEKLTTNEPGSFVSFEKVLLISGTTTEVGVPYVKGAKIVAKLVKHDRSRKLIILKRSPGKYFRKNGHRQHFSGLLVTEIHDGKGNVAKIDTNHKNQKYLK
jgi:large subunit ribosomal protein L21